MSQAAPGAPRAGLDEAGRVVDAGADAGRAAAADGHPVAGDGTVVPPMARPYQDELSELPATYAWAHQVDLDMLTSAVRHATSSTVVAMGSGGALTTAAMLAAHHRHYTGFLAATSTPLLIDAWLPRDGRVSVWVVSAGGRNHDIRAALKTVLDREPKHVAVLCGTANSPLAREAHSVGWLDTVAVQLPSRDGFLAVNSVLAFTTLVARTYGAVYRAAPLPADLTTLLERSFPDYELLAGDAAGIWERPTTIVVHGASTAAAAADLESRFTEAALGSLQMADFRNFAHGRHVWLAKRGASSAVIALVGPDDHAVAAKTLRALPREIPVLQLKFNGELSEVAIASVMASMHLAGLAGRARGIDPGRPGVPEFGRKLYSMKATRRPASGGLSSERSAPIARKAGCSVKALEMQGRLDEWHGHLAAFEQMLTGACFRAVALDYDGTLREGEDRDAPPCADVVAQLNRKSTCRRATSTSAPCTAVSSVAWPGAWLEGTCDKCLNFTSMVTRTWPTSWRPLPSLWQMDPCVSWSARSNVRPTAFASATRGARNSKRKSSDTWPTRAVRIRDPRCVALCS